MYHVQKLVIIAHRDLVQSIYGYMYSYHIITRLINSRQDLPGRVFGSLVSGRVGHGAGGQGNEP